MSNVNVKATIEKNGRFQNFLMQLKNQRSRNKNVCGFFSMFNLKKIMTF